MAPLLEVDEITKRFGGITALEGVSLAADAGEIVGLIGPNGAGKTTAFNVITRLYRPDEGDVRFDGESLLDTRANGVVRRGIARTFQNVASLHDLSVMDIAKLGSSMRSDRSAFGHFADLFRSEKAIEEELTETILRPLQLTDVTRKPVQTLSYGRRKAVDLARALAAHPQLLLLDEPVAGLTAQEGMAMAAVIRDVRDRLGCAVIMVEHKMDVVMSTCDRIAVMAAGNKIFEGLPAEVQADAEVRRVYLGEP